MKKGHSQEWPFFLCSVRKLIVKQLYAVRRDLWGAQGTDEPRRLMAATGGLYYVAYCVRQV